MKLGLAAIALAGCVLAKPPLPPLRSPDMPPGARALAPREVKSEKVRVRASEWTEPDATGLNGRVRDDHGEPEAGATLVVLEPSGSDHDQVVLSDGHGEFHLVLPPGPHALTLYLLDDTATLDVEVPATGAAHIDIVIEPSPTERGET